MKDLPGSEHALVVGTDLSDEAAWACICGGLCMVAHVDPVGFTVVLRWRGPGDTSTPCRPN
jgi:hypothetical protein